MISDVFSPNYVRNKIICLEIVCKKSQELAVILRIRDFGPSSENKRNLAHYLDYNDHEVMAVIS